MEIPINYWAVLAAALANMAVGSLWYGPVFGKTWMGLTGITNESMKSMKLSAKQAVAGGFVVSLVMAYVLAMFIFIYGAVSASGALELGFWIWLGFLASTSISSFLWEGKPFKLFVLNAAEQLVAIAVMALVLVFWQ